MVKHDYPENSSSLSKQQKKLCLLHTLSETIPFSLVSCFIVNKKSEITTTYRKKKNEIKKAEIFPCWKILTNPNVI